jgi:hypothetical protein
VSAITQLMSEGVDELLTGLSSCYLPRHGIIYFDSSNKPVASISICFECDRISIWQEGLNYEPQVNEKRFNTKKAEDQIARLEDIIRNAGVPVHERPEIYFDAVAKDSLNYTESNKITFDFKDGPSIDWKFDFTSVTQWRNSAAQSFVRYVDEVDNKYTDGGDEYKFRKWSGPDGTYFLFSGEGDGAILSEAIINDPDILLPSGISVGMSLEQVQLTFEVWDGMAYPEIILVKNGGLTIEYRFKRRTLTSIQIGNY